MQTELNERGSEEVSLQAVRCAAIDLNLLATE